MAVTELRVRPLPLIVPHEGQHAHGAVLKPRSGAIYVAHGVSPA